MISYIAFLRGINVNGRKVLMQDLEQVFEQMGFINSKTLLASGNVLFDSIEKNEELLKKEIQEALQKQFGFSIPVVLRTKEEIVQLVKKRPFQYEVIENGMRLQITFFDKKVTGDFPIHEKGFTLFALGERELGSVIQPEGKTTELMTFIDKTFGKNSTTRNWNTLQKLTKI
ncbi:MAG TPA: DUF1697 domain-containing protein [Candidatus Saccharimonadales bacterium]|nr:DUF1697 domain-containing protein [Candidatus Saccharimonadales bacterium]